MRLQIKNATVQYGGDVILERADFEIHDKEKIAVVGRNGCGKTTLLKLIVGDLEMANLSSDESCLFNMQGKQSVGFLRQINFPDGNVKVRDEINKVFAEVFDVEKRMRQVEHALATCVSDETNNNTDSTGNTEGETDVSERCAGEENNLAEERLLSEYAHLQKRWDALGGDSCQREMEIMFQKFGFSLEDLDRTIGTFSGGQQTKVAFMKLLLSRPDILLLDEPTNHLDLPTIEWLEGYLKGYDKAVVIVSHDRAFLDRIIDVTYEIEYHRIKRYPGNYTAFVRQKEEALAKQEKDYEAQQAEIKRLTEWIEKWKNTPSKISSVYSKRKMIEHMELVEPPRKFDTTTFRAYFSPRQTSYSEVINAKKLKIGYDRELSEVSFRLMKGERIAVIGENGKGKSTLLKTIMGMIEPLGGSFIIGQNVDVGYFDQQKAVINDEDPEQSVMDNFHDLYPRLTNGEVRSTLGAFAFSQEEVEKKLGQLSGGERVRLALCKMFYTRPNLLILDEPTNHMDILGKESLEKMLADYSGTVLFVSHDRFFINKIATEILDFTQDGVRYYGCGYEEYLQEKKKILSRAQGAVANSQRASAPNASSGPQGFSTSEVSPNAQKDNSDLSQYFSAEDIELFEKNPGKLRSKLERKIEKINEDMERIESETDGLKEELNNPQLASDFEKLIQIQEKINANESETENLLGQLLELEEQLEVIGG